MLQLQHNLIINSRLPRVSELYNKFNLGMYIHWCAIDAQTLIFKTTYNQHFIQNIMRIQSYFNKKLISRMSPYLILRWATFKV